MRMLATLLAWRREYVERDFESRKFLPLIPPDFGWVDLQEIRHAMKGNFTGKRPFVYLNEAVKNASYLICLGAQASVLR